MILALKALSLFVGLSLVMYVVGHRTHALLVSAVDWVVGRLFGSSAEGDE